MSTKAYTWGELRRATIGRQFPRVRGVGADEVVDVVGRVGPIQSQAPRAPFVAVSSRLPGASHQAIVEAYESLRLIRATSLRFTVHTSTRAQHGWLDALARRTLAGVWCRTLKLELTDVRRVQAEIEAATADRWRDHDDLNQHLIEWLSAEATPSSVRAAHHIADAPLVRGHSAMVRRPLRGGWHQQMLAGYRAAAFVLGEPSPAACSEAELDSRADEALTALVRTHLAAFGPATRRDIAWWSGEGLRRVDAAVVRLGDEVTSRPGPGGLDYLDLADVTQDRPSDVEAREVAARDVGVRLLPEYDGTILGYEPTSGRLRFASAAAPDQIWNRSNGVFRPTVFSHGMLRATWKLVNERSRCLLVVTMFADEKPFKEGQMADQAAAVRLALDRPIDEVRVMV